ncbi:MAG: efflux RND transporter periplasmic adaptor subunit [Pleurocapsa sp.]
MINNKKNKQKFKSSSESGHQLENNQQQLRDRTDRLNTDKELYIAEIDGEFVTVNYQSHLQEPVIAPLETSASSQTKGKEVKPTDSEGDNSSLSPDRVEKSKLQSSFFAGKKGLFMGIGLGILLAGGINYFVNPKSASTTATAPTTEVTKSTTSPRAVTITTVQTTPVERVLESSGTVAAYEEIPVMSQATGLQVRQILADRGNFVSQGQILAQLDRKTLEAEKVQAQAAIAQAEARLDELQAGTRTEEVAQAQQRVKSIEAELAQAQLDLDLVQKRVQRNQTLEAEGAITRDRLDEILNQERTNQANLRGIEARLQEAKQQLAQLQAGPRPQTINQAKAELAQAQGQLQLIDAQLEDTSIVAPASGIIAERNTQVGNITSTSEPLFSIIENGRLELRLKVPETLVRQITPGQKVTITSDADSNLKLSGKVREIDPVIDDSSRQATVKVDLPSGANLKPGMFLNAAITTTTTQGTTIPVEALLPQSDNSAIAFVVQDDNRVKAQSIIMGEILNNQTVEILEGLKPGDRIVLKGSAYLKDGDLVNTNNTIQS